MTIQNEKHGDVGYITRSALAGSSNGYFSMTWGGVLGLQMWGEEDSNAVRDGAKYILENSKFDYNSAVTNLYAHYYETQAMMIRGGEEWETYNAMFKDQLIGKQNENGSWKGDGANSMTNITATV